MVFCYLNCQLTFLLHLANLLLSFWLPLNFLKKPFATSSQPFVTFNFQLAFCQIYLLPTIQLILALSYPFCQCSFWQHICFQIVLCYCQVLTGFLPLSAIFFNSLVLAFSAKSFCVPSCVFTCLVKCQLKINFSSHKKNKYLS